MNLVETGLGSVSMYCQDVLMSIMVDQANYDLAFFYSTFYFFQGQLLIVHADFYFFDAIVLIIFLHYRLLMTNR